ncbi:TetR/AcrR family transcriptional regulator [Arachnia propionica]|uniref:TetR/AcrR family transcriptional regulator n=1 Tax=Arachnia propionica TaxID=1750 RepID=A0A3P1T3N7_9ACTN|nr:TetR/AcrR family transcriptional regulator [Arachnia propionica]
MIAAALTVAEEHGTSAVTLDSVAEQAKVTKKGLLYHFPSKHALIAGIHEHLAARFDQALLEATGKEPESASLTERTRGYIRVALETPNTVELQFILEARGEPYWLAPWERVNHRWFPDEPPRRGTRHPRPALPDRTDGGRRLLGSGEHPTRPDEPSGPSTPDPGDPGPPRLTDDHRPVSCAPPSCAAGGRTSTHTRGTPPSRTRRS